AWVIAAAMSTHFCTQCGAKLLSDARFCAACGRPVGGGATPARRRFPLERWAPLLVVGTVLVVAGTAVLVGARSAPPPTAPPAPARRRAECTGDAGRTPASPDPRRRPQSHRQASRRGEGPAR